MNMEKNLYAPDVMDDADADNMIHAMLAVMCRRLGGEVHFTPEELDEAQPKEGERLAASLNPELGDYRLMFEPDPEDDDPSRYGQFDQYGSLQ